MKILIPTSIVLACLVVSGCKISITAPSTGTVETVSGNVLCQADNACELDVGTDAFNEEFIATPSEGYEFRWWRGGDRALCGTANGSCTLDWGQTMLASDEVFYLEPVFTVPHGSTVLEDVDSSACFNREAWQQGARVTLRYRQPQLDGQPPHYYQREVLGDSTFNGTPVIAVQTTVRDAATKNPQSLQTSYFSINESESSVNLLGAVISGNIDADGNHIFTPDRFAWYDFGIGHHLDADNYYFTYDSALPVFLALAKGDTSSFNYVRHMKLQQITVDDYSRVSGNVRYEGMQSITVPAGDFDACRFHYTVVSEDDKTLSEEKTVWVAKDSGIVLIEADEKLKPTRYLLSVTP